MYKITLFYNFKFLNRYFMSRIKNAQLRYRIIDRALRNKYKPFPTKQDLRTACEEAIFGSSIGTDICDSTIEKDMFAMRMEFDAPIKYSKREKGYYYTEEDFTIENIPLTEDDIEAIKFASQTLMQFKDVGIFKQFSFAIDKIFDRVHIANNPTDKAIEEFVQFENVPEAEGNEFLPDILKAIKEQLLLSFNYASFKSGKSKSREVLPLLLKEFRNRWYLIAQDNAKNKVITYGLDRIKDLIILEEVGSLKTDFNADNFFKYSLGITANEDRPEVIEFKVDKVGSKYLQSLPLHTSQTKIKEGKKRDTFRLEVILSEELKRTFLSYGDQLEVIKPSKLRNDLKTTIIALNNLYA